jgi:hypothetical protein
VQDLEIDLDVEGPSVSQAKLLKAVREFDSYLRANTERIPNYGERRHAGEAISTAFTESAVNQVISKRMVKSSRCGGHPAAPTCCSRSAPGSSTTTWPPTSTAGTPASTHTPPDREEPVRSA